MRPEPRPARRPDLLDVVLAVPLISFGLLLTGTLVLAFMGLPMVLIGIELLTPRVG